MRVRSTYIIHKYEHDGHSITPLAHGTYTMRLYMYDTHMYMYDTHMYMYDTHI